MILEESWGALGAWTAGVGIGLSLVAVVVRGDGGEEKGGRRKDKEEKENSSYKQKDRNGRHLLLQNQ